MEKFNNLKDTLGNILWLEKWYSKLGVKFPSNEIKNSSIRGLDFNLNSNKDHKLFSISGKLAPRIVFGCDNQISELHAFSMFEHFYQQGGRIFDTAVKFIIQDVEGGQSEYIDNPGQHPNRFEIDVINHDKKLAYEIKWRDAGTDGDHKNKEFR